MADGAQRALKGYLYQFIGAAGLTARSKSGATGASRRHKTLFEKVFGSKVFHEVADMDAIAVAPDGNAVGFQYKYSLNTPPEPIDPDELRGILDAFHRSTERATNFQFAEYVLVSNRSLTAEAGRIFGTRNGNNADRSLYPQRGKGNDSKAYKSAIKQFSDADTAASERHKILAKLDLHLAGDFRDWVLEVKEYAGSRGVLAVEFDKAFDCLIGDILGRAAGSPLELTAEFLNGSLLGVPDARPLVQSDGEISARDAALSAHTEFIRHTFVENVEYLIPRRSLLLELEEEIRSKSVVFLYGEGGSGKSVLAAEYLREDASRRYVGAVVASTLDGEWPGRSFNSWRSPNHAGQLKVESIEGILARLRNADKTAPKPVLLLDVDGLDEISPEHRHNARRLIDKFFRRTSDIPPEASLLVTLRSEAGGSGDSFQDILREWLVTEIPAIHVDRVGKVIVPGFGKEDLLDAASALGDEYRWRISRLLDFLDGDQADFQSVGDVGLAGEPLPSSRPDFVESFLHPAMWQSFVDLSAGDRFEVLDQNPAAFEKLAIGFLVKFSVKVNSRHGSFPKSRTFDILKAIGGSLPIHGRTFDRGSNWIRSARGPAADHEAAVLYEEAISYGLIREEGRGRWNWRHGLVGDYLREG